MFGRAPHGEHINMFQSFIYKTQYLICAAMTMKDDCNFEINL